MANYPYRCGACKAVGVKLWRSYSMFLREDEFRCVDCACAESDGEYKAEDYRADGSRVIATLIVPVGGGWVAASFDGDVTPSSVGKNFEVKKQEGDQIGWYVPAIGINGRANPDAPEEYWGYSSWTEERKDDWDYWIELPLRAAAEVKVDA